MSHCDVPLGNAKALQDLRTLGWTILRGNISPRLVQKVLADGASRPNYRYVRQVYDGLPHRIIERLLGMTVFSGLYEVGKHWHRSRPDVHASGASRDFIAGVDLVTPLESLGLDIELIPASRRLRPTESPLATSARAVHLAMLDLLLVDSCTLRRATMLKPALSFTVTRDWITPTEVWPECSELEVPERARQFLGGERIPCQDVMAWLKRTHSTRT